jgi:hypothetical protein
MNTFRPGLMAPGSASGPRIFLAAIALIMAMAGRADGGPALLPAAERSYQAAVRGDPDAQADLAASYARGDGVPQSDAFAFQWCLRAAAQGHAEAQLMLSGLFANGKGVPQDYVTAYKWASLAAASAREPDTLEKVVKTIRFLAPQLSDAEISEARARASDWKPRQELILDYPASSQQGQLGPPVVQLDPGTARRFRAGSPMRLSSHVGTARGMAYRGSAGATRVKSCRCHMPARLQRLARRWGL